MSSDLTIILICSFVAFSGALLGPFLVLRKVSLLSDAISHSVVFGIAAGYLIFRTTSSLPMLIAAALTGLLTVWLTELLLQTRLVKEDASIGLVFPALFSLGVILITRFLTNVHIDTDTALVGEVALSPFDTIEVFGIEIARSLVNTGVVAVITLLFVGLLYKELKLVTFDRGLATALGFAPGLLTYGLMSLVSVSAVGAFDAVGSVLFIGFIVVPAASAYLLTDSLFRMIVLSAIFGVAGSVAGYQLASTVDASISGSIVLVLGVIFLLTLIFAPERGLLAGYLRRRRQRWQFAATLLVGHLMTHEDSNEELAENALTTLPEHLHWKPDYAAEIIQRANRQGWVEQHGEILRVTEHGRAAATALLSG
jgi:manganese/zinc/iron transport system permease protein